MFKCLKFFSPFVAVFPVLLDTALEVVAQRNKSSMAAAIHRDWQSAHGGTMAADKKIVRRWQKGNCFSCFIASLSGSTSLLAVFNSIMQPVSYCLFAFYQAFSCPSSSRSYIQFDHILPQFALTPCVASWLPVKSPKSHSFKLCCLFKQNRTANTKRPDN